MAFDVRDPSGSQLGTFRIERLIERGGFSTVYLAEDVRPQLRRKVALKILNQDLTADPTFRERFLLESLMVAGLDDHPAIVPVYDAGEDQGHLYIAMRYIEGADLKRLIEEHGPLDPGFVASVMSQIAGALDVAHAAGLVHRDVKPGNVLLSRDLKRAYLADFGLTKKLDTDQALTQVRSYLGTLYYSPPEQFDGDNVGPAADIYALGAVIYHALSGSPPFPGSPESIIAAHLTKPVPHVSAARPGLPAPLDGVVTRAMAKEPQHRYATASELAADLARILAPGDQSQPGLSTSGASSQGIPPPPPPQQPPPYQPAPSDPGLTVSGGGYPPVSGQGPAPPVGGTPSWPPPPPPPTSGGGGPPPSKPNRLPLVLGAVALVVVLVAAGLFFALRGGDDEESADGDGTERTPSSESTTASTTTTTTGPAPFPDDDESALLSTVPDPAGEDCERDESPAGTDGVRAAVQCTVADVDELGFALFDSPADLTAAYEDQVDQSSAEPGGGDCRDADDVAHPYEADGGRGRVACYIENDEAFITWTNDDAITSATASRTDGDSVALYEWWQDLVGRTDEPESLPNPSVQEEALLNKISADYRDTCIRARIDIEDAFEGELSTLQCFPDVPGVESTIYYAFATPEQMDGAYTQIRDGSGQTPDEPPEGTCPGETSYNSEDFAAGRRLCYLFEGTPTILWTVSTEFDGFFILSEVRASDDNFDAILPWWESGDGDPIP